MTDLSSLFKSHRSIRKFATKPIDSTLIEKVCDEAIAGASSSGNMNSVSIVITRDEDRRKRLHELHFKQDMILSAPLLLTFCADFHRTRAWLARRSARDNFDNLIGYHVAAFDAMIVAQNVCLGFQARGLGICYMGSTLHSMTEIAAFLELPETCVPVTTIVVGYPDETPEKRDRLPLTAFLHDERYRHPDGESIDAIYAERERIAWERWTSNPATLARLAEHGIENVAQAYTCKIKYDRDTFRKDSKKLKQLLEAKGFLQD
ncbi:MAG TPA: nitroreductase family protein [Trinickia sp.]|uniref:nitroreductase family protein n=1 Tax=Trinickia sp. TaxID=2571163 RepID=UPI002B5A6C8B|nr:nitroreductase family protein [Trinickia sp.]HTI17527.1 nitroreductase family protein [Trinickia sp.]